MTSTDELRRLLDERGVEWTKPKSATEFIQTTFLCNGWGIEVLERSIGLCVTATNIFDTPEQAIAATLGTEINGDTSDGYHAFNELYHHRAVLFSVIVRDHKELAWKARKHHDGTMYDGMFIVGIEAPKGQATYHYDLDPYWEMFDCEEREFAPEWDGHTPDEAIARIAELGNGTCEVIGSYYYDDYDQYELEFSCGHSVNMYDKEPPNYCPSCGRKIVTP